MILLDTDHLTVLKYRMSQRSVRLTERLTAASATGEMIGTTIIGVEEQMRGWLAAIAKEKQPLRQVKPYRELAELFDYFRAFHVALFDEPAARLFDGYGSIRIRANDRKVAAIAITQNALLLTGNHRDFVQVPGIRFENWMD